MSRSNSANRYLRRHSAKEPSAERSVHHSWPSCAKENQPFVMSLLPTHFYLLVISISQKIVI